MIEFIGEVETAPNGFGFIDIDTVRRVNGEPHGLETHADIFVPQSECATPLQMGMVLRFKVKPNEVKGLGHYMAVEAVEVISTTALVPSTGPVMPGFTWSLVPSGPVRDLPVPMHAGMKAIDPDLLEKVKENRALAGLPADEDEVRLTETMSIRDTFEDYLLGLFAGFSGLAGFSFAIVDYDGAAQDALIAASMAENRDFGMAEQALKLEADYARFKHTRRLLAWILERNLLRPGTQLSPLVLRSLIELVEKTGGAAMQGKTVDDVIGVIEFMNRHGLLRPNTVIGMEHLPDLYMAVPIWFFLFRSKSEQEQAEHNWDKAAQNFESAFGGITPGLEYFGTVVPNQRWANTFLMLNRRLRNISLYTGDVIPSNVMAVMREAKEVFDYVAIATPYHDMVAAEWTSVDWVNGLDPYVIGFRRGLPVMFVLGRFSDSGIFPLHSELVADTIDFLRRNIEKMRGFNTQEKGGLRKHVMSWMHVQPDGAPRVDKIDEVGTRFIEHTRQLLASFDQGHLFEWLRGEWDLPNEALVRTTD